ncbi:hypothetical protein [Streptomyces sp. ALI-76-A]|uniref:hypothetical protein n=1 Tax=Streptomyces sp. ALI-76-A TaxID=3025736 RepID=UPI00256F3C86|nr:hypothetical protein [Streptomyces sp. ALI-76-A]MDL5201247.1 hypothetical protein [Streptomyces sp. ALI-76-A]
MLPSPDAGIDTAAPRRVTRRWPLTVLRACTCVLLLLTLAQPVLAGMFITGDTDLLDLHALNATLVSVMSWLTVAAAVTLWRPGGGPVWPVGLTLVTAGLVEAQSGFGYARQLALHIPLGVALVAGLTAQTYWVFAHRAGHRTENGSR